MDGKNKQEVEDLHLHFIVLLNLIIEKIEELEESGALVGKVKQFLKNSKKYFEKFMQKIYDLPKEKDRLESSVGVFVVQKRVEKALKNKYVITEYERERRLKETLINEGVENSKITRILNGVKVKNILKH